MRPRLIAPVDGRKETAYPGLPENSTSKFKHFET